MVDDFEPGLDFHVCFSKWGGPSLKIYAEERRKTKTRKTSKRISKEDLEEDLKEDQFAERREMGEEWSETLNTRK